MCLDSGADSDFQTSRGDCHPWVWKNWEFERFHQAINGEHHCSSHAWKGRVRGMMFILFIFKTGKDLIKKHFCFCRRTVSKATKEFHALGIVSLFPSLKDLYSKKGYVSLHCSCSVRQDFQSVRGIYIFIYTLHCLHFLSFSTSISMTFRAFLEWCVKTVQR